MQRRNGDLLPRLLQVGLLWPDSSNTVSMSMSMNVNANFDGNPNLNASPIINLNCNAVKSSPVIEILSDDDTKLPAKKEAFHDYQPGEYCHMRSGRGQPGSKQLSVFSIGKKLIARSSNIRRCQLENSKRGCQPPSRPILSRCNDSREDMQSCLRFTSVSVTI